MSTVKGKRPGVGAEGFDLLGFRQPLSSPGRMRDRGWRVVGRDVHSSPDNDRPG